MKASTLLPILSLALGLQLSGASDAPIQFLLHPHGPLVVGTVGGTPRAFLGPNDLEVFISFRADEDGDLVSDSPEVPKIEGMWKGGRFLKADGTPFPILATGSEGRGTGTDYEGTFDETEKVSLRLIFHEGGLVKGSLVHGGESLELLGSNFEDGRLVLVSKDFRFAASVWKTKEGGRITWSGMGSLDGKADASVSFSR